MGSLFSAGSAFCRCIVSTAMLAAIACQPSWANESNEHIVYTMQARDNLRDIAARYADGADAFAKILSYNRITNPGGVAAGYALKIPRAIVKYTPSSAKVSAMSCRNVTRLDGETSAPVQLDDKLTEGAVVRIPPACQLDIALEDASVLRMMSGAVIKLKTLRRNVLESSPEIRIELLDGRVEVSVPRRRPDGDAPFEIRTPKSVAAVRGTEFRVGFDANQSNSQVEVLKGAVAAQGNTDKDAKLTNAGTGVPIGADGVALAIEDLLVAPRVPKSGGSVGRDGMVALKAPRQAERFFARSFDDASFARINDEQYVNRAQLALAPKGSVAVFQEWSSLSSTGIMGYTAKYGICRGYKRAESWRCNVVFSLEGLDNAKLRFEKLDDQGHPLRIMDKPVKPSANNQLVLRGLPGGQYQWQLDYDMPIPSGGMRKFSLSGKFELFAIPSEP